jgi:hypothetical protein
MTPLGQMRLIFLPVALVGLYLVPRLLVPGTLGIAVGVALAGLALLWPVVTTRRN